MKKESTTFNHILCCLNGEAIEECKEDLSHFHALPPESQNRILFEISKKKDDISFKILNYLADTNIPDQTLKYKIFNLILEKSQNNADFLKLFIHKGEKKILEQAVPILANALMTETDVDVLIDTINVLGKIRENSCVDVIADFMFYDHEDLKKTAITALSEIGTTNAALKLELACNTSKSDSFMKRTLFELKDRIGKDKTLKTKQTEQLASKKDTIEELGDTSDLHQLLLMFNSSLITDRHLAIDLLIEMGQKALPAITQNIAAHTPSGTAHSLFILGKIGSNAAIKPIMKILQNGPDDINIKLAAYQAIKNISFQPYLTGLLEGLKHESEQVRIAAAMAVDKNHSDVLLQGLKDLLENEGNNDSKAKIVFAIIDGLAEHIFTNLLTSKIFVTIASDYLKTIPEKMALPFLSILEREGFEFLAADIEEHLLDGQNDSSPTAYVVNSSPVILQIFSKYLFKNGYTPILFEDAEKAMVFTKAKKPDVVIVDLFPLKFNGIEFIQDIRIFLTPDDVPIAVIVPEDFFSKNSRKVAEEENILEKIQNAGADYILTAPVRENDLKNFLTIGEKRSGNHLTRRLKF